MMSLCEWMSAYTKLNNKLTKKTALTTDEIDEVLTILEKIQEYAEKMTYEVMKRQ